MIAAIHVLRLQRRRALNSADSYRAQADLEEASAACSRQLAIDSDARASELTDALVKLGDDVEAHDREHARLSTEASKQVDAMTCASIALGKAVPAI